MKYIIMADGKGTRWNNSLGIPKHLVEIQGERLLDRTVRQIKTLDKKADVIITSHDERYEIEGATRYEPKNNVMEIDRFTYELIEDNVCFLYGDTFYTDEAMETIVNTHTDKLLFFGSKRSIVAIKVAVAEVFKDCIDQVKKLFIEGKIKNCIGWQTYQCFNGYEYDVKKVGDNYVLIDDQTLNINNLEDFQSMNN